MNNKATTGSNLPHSPIPELSARRPFAVHALTVLLFVQAAAFIYLGFTAIDWTRPVSHLILTYALELAYLVMGLLNLMSAVGFLRLRPAAWIMAVIVQGMYLLLTLSYYVVRRPDDDQYIFYGLMALSVVIVIYLNYAEVPTLFLRWRAPQKDSRLAAKSSGYYENFAD